ncbi:MAG: hypothetical protein HWE25_07400 [Alphaproteobacteria bacterium]|nr:hypothetical protein [Alphaproteobacteria bacterium]
MAVSHFYDDGIGLDYDDFTSRSFELAWPVSEVVLASAIDSGKSLNSIARQYDVGLDEVIELCELYDLDIG